MRSFPRRDASNPEPINLGPFAAMAEQARKTAPTEQEVKRSLERLEPQQRETRLIESGVHGAITSEDMACLIRGTGFLQTSALTACQSWVEDRTDPNYVMPRPFNIAVLVGLTGRGKTFAGAWLNSVLGGRYATAETVRRAFEGKNWRDAVMLEPFMNSRCVVVDDAGGEMDANTAAAAMFELVNRRAGDSRAWTLITANLTKDDFIARYGERTVRRIEHVGHIIEVEGADLRRRG